MQTITPTVSSRPIRCTMPNDSRRPQRPPAKGRWLFDESLVSCLALLLAAVLAVRGYADDDGGGPLLAVLDLPEDGYLAGSLLDVPAEPAGARVTFLWRSPAFAGPFEFALDSVVGVRFPRRAEAAPPRPAGPWRIELESGDMLVGDVESIDEQRVVVRIGTAAAATRLSVRRGAVASIFRGASGEAYAVPVGLDGWQQAPAHAWRDEAGRLTNASLPATLVREFQVGQRTRYDMTFSWQEPPTLRIGIGAGPVDEASRAYRIEVGPDGMVAVRDEHGTAADGNGRADLQTIGDVPERGLKLTVFVDQQAGRLAVMLPESREPVVDLTIPPTGEGAAGGFALAVLAGEASLDDLRVSPWRGGSLSLDDRHQGSVRLRDGGASAVVVQAMKQDSGTLLTRPVGGPATGEPRQIPLDTVDEILFPSAGDGAATDDPPADVQAIDVCGVRLTGRLLRVEQGIVWLAHPAVEAAVPFPVATLATLATTGRPVPGAKLPGRRGRLACGQGSVWGCLVHGDADGGGATAAGGEAGASALAWQPVGSLNARPLAPAADGGQPQATITYAERPRSDAATSAAGAIGGIGGHIGVVNGRPAVVGLIAGSAAQRAGVMPGEVIVAIAPRGDGRFVETEGLSLEDVQHLLRGRAGSRLQLRLVPVGEKRIQEGIEQGKPREITLVRQALAQLGRNPRLMQQALQAHDRLAPPAAPNIEQNAGNRFGSRLILRTGETLPCHLESIDDQGVHVRLPESEPVAVAGDLVQAVELVPTFGKSITAEKFRSLTMLPRSQRQQPPTHVLRSLQGDYLRGRLVSMDDRTIRIAVEADPRGEPLAIPRGDVARLIWLHPENLESPWEPPQHRGNGGLLVESVAADDSRLRMTATRINGNVLLGTSPVVGPCRIDLESIDRLLIGGESDDSSRSFPYSQWKLKPAPEPRNLPSGRP